MKKLERWLENNLVFVFLIANCIGISIQTIALLYFLFVK